VIQKGKSNGLQTKDRRESRDMDADWLDYDVHHRLILYRICRNWSSHGNYKQLDRIGFLFCLRKNLGSHKVGSKRWLTDGAMNLNGQQWLWLYASMAALRSARLGYMVFGRP